MRAPRSGSTNSAYDSGPSSRRVGASFWLLAPARREDGPLSYALFVEPERGADLAGVADEVDEELRASFHYDYCRRLGQLGPCRLFAVEPGSGARARYLRGRAELGQRLGDVKPAAVDASDRWAELLPGRFL